MKIGPLLLKELQKSYPPDTVVESTFQRYDLNIKTDDQGRAMLFFIGRRDEKGLIKGERFARRLTLDPDGKVIKDHWDNKGRA